MSPPTAPRSTTLDNCSRSLLAIGIGASAVVGLSMLLERPVGEALDARFVPQLDSAVRAPISNPIAWVSGWLLFYGLALHMGGFLAAVIAPRHRVGHAVVVALLIDVLAIAFRDISIRGDARRHGSTLGPELLLVAAVVAVTTLTALLGGWLGATLASRRARPAYDP